MDTKWKNKKIGISFMIFFAGVSLTLGNSISLLQKLPGDFWKHPDRVLQDDYQQSSRFREYISGRLETFLSMATNSFGNNYYDFYGYTGSYIDSMLESTATEDEATVLWEGNSQMQAEYGMSDQELAEYLNWKYYYNGWENYDWGDQKDPITKEQREELQQKVAQRYHDSIKKDQNLLYSIAYDGKVLYANSDLLPTDGSRAMPEGYNFLLEYTEGKVQIFKDGKELDVYGDGYYRDDSEWYVPGYRNFTVDEEMKKAVIYMAVAQDPVLYTESSYGRGSYRQMDNSLYWMHYNTMSNRKMLILNMVGLTAGLALLAMAFLCRRAKREADAGIARFTGKIWFEGKLLFLGVILYLLFYLFGEQFYWNYGTTLIEEVRWMADVVSADYGYEISTIGSYIGQMLFYLPARIWLILFWMVYLIVNDLHRNQKIWRHGLIAKLHRAFTARALQQPLSVRTAHRSGIAFAAAAVYGLLMLAGGIIGYCQGNHNGSTVWGMGSLFFLILVGFLILQYRICVKNMETARDLEGLSDRIRDIRNGNYAENSVFAGDRNTSGSEDFAGSNAENGIDSADGESEQNKNTDLEGHDLADAMTQLEDIRHGMANAVDEQMKSERMKVELIANVSHDIKTPLTSIISYVQFLKEEKELPEHVQDYIKILDEKSQRLKNMVQDVFAVSKAASGELPMNMEELDFGKLLRQTLADMEEQIADSKVSFRTELPDSPVMIMADGQRMYRVFQNLFQNAIQYSLDGSRVFVTLQTDGTMAVASVKNTSHLELEKGKDFSERFTRGDQSRTDGGSGLGLSIAQSFTEACGGQFSWETNADLFVVTVSFRILEDKA